MLKRLSKEPEMSKTVGDDGTRIRPTTLRDVARVVGVSQSAVSMALADHPRISASRKQEVLLTAQRLGYVANSAGRALRAQRSDSIALVVPNTGRHVFGHPYFMHLLVGVNNASNERDSTVMISTNPDEQHGVAAYERVLRSRAVDGAIVASAAVADPNVSRMVDSTVPVVLVGRFPNLPSAVSVAVDDTKAAYELTTHLLVDHGIRRIGHISGPLDHQTSTDRYQGFRDAIGDLGLPVTQALATGDFSEESGSAAARALLDSTPDLQAIFAANDEMAYGALLECRERGLRVPEDIALVGFDDFGVSRLTTPALTTVRVPAEELGRTAANLLYQLIDGKIPKLRHTILAVELVLRESCGYHPADA